MLILQFFKKKNHDYARVSRVIQNRFSNIKIYHCYYYNNSQDKRSETGV